LLNDEFDEFDDENKLLFGLLDNFSILTFLFFLLLFFNDKLFVEELKLVLFLFDFFLRCLGPILNETKINN
jgi:hypothetical protein